jgi:hypothetical protein
MAENDEVERKNRRPGEEPYDVRPLRRKLFLGALAWIGFGTIGGYLLKGTRAEEAVYILSVAGWFVLAFFTIIYMKRFIFGKR